MAIRQEPRVPYRAPRTAVASCRALGPLHVHVVDPDRMIWPVAVLNRGIPTYRAPHARHLQRSESAE